MVKPTRKNLSSIYKKLLDAFGPQYWWPAKTKFEVIVGAILTQNTNWSNVEKALSNLKKEKVLDTRSLSEIPSHKLASLIKPAGYFNVKAKRIKSFMKFLFSEYSGKLSSMQKEDAHVLRKKLLSVNGIGPETADSIVLYAFNNPVFVVDAYTKRVFSRHELISKDDDYNCVQDVFMRNLSHDTKMFNEYHALIVKLCKEFCKTKPICSECPLRKQKSIYK